MFQDSWQSSATHALHNTFIFLKTGVCKILRISIDDITSHLFAFSMFERTKVEYVLYVLPVAAWHGSTPKSSGIYGYIGIGIIAFHIVIDIAGRLSLESVATCWVFRG